MNREATLDNIDENVQALIDALANDDQLEIARLFPDFDFLLIDIGGGEDQEEANALAMEVDDYQALVVFLSQELVQQFVNDGEFFDDDEPVSCFSWSGQNILDSIPDGLGILFNPESEDCFVMDPPVVASFRDRLSDLVGDSDE